MITQYADEEVIRIVSEFLNKFREDSRPFAAKLKSLPMSKGAFSYLINGKSKPQKKTLETMRAYLENRPPKWSLVQPGQAYCYLCESIVDKSRIHGRWSCYSCSNQLNQTAKSKKRSVYNAIRRQSYWRTMSWDNPEREAILDARSRRYFEKKASKG